MVEALSRARYAANTSTVTFGDMSDKFQEAAHKHSAQHLDAAWPDVLVELRRLLMSDAANHKSWNGYVDYASLARWLCGTEEESNG